MRETTETPANTLDITVFTYPFLLPYFIPVILAASTTAGVEEAGMPRHSPSPFSTRPSNFHSWMHLGVVIFGLPTGYRRSKRS